jgi:hypothetical protein
MAYLKRAREAKGSRRRGRCDAIPNVRPAERSKRSEGRPAMRGLRPAIRRFESSRPSQSKFFNICNGLRDIRCADWYITLVHLMRGAAMQSPVAR